MTLLEPHAAPARLREKTGWPRKANVSTTRRAAEVDIRPQIVMHQLKGINFPANKADRVAHAQQNHAPDEVLEEIARFEEREYDTMADVMKAYGRAHH